MFALVFLGIILFRCFTDQVVFPMDENGKLPLGFYFQQDEARPHIQNIHFVKKFFLLGGLKLVVYSR